MAKRSINITQQIQFLWTSCHLSNTVLTSGGFARHFIAANFPSFHFLWPRGYSSRTRRARTHAHALQAVGNSSWLLRVLRGCDTDFRSCVPQIPQKWARSLKFHCVRLFFMRICSTFDWDISRVKSWRRERCVCGEQRERRTVLLSDCLPQPGSSAGLREPAESQGSHFYQVKRLEAPLACLVKG